MLGGCSWNNWLIRQYSYDDYLTIKTLNGAIKAIADQLQNSANEYVNKGTTTITSFVDANALERTNLVGRTISESLFSELFKRGFKITDFRGKDSISVGRSGEFFITRDASRLRTRTVNTFVLAGTYSIVESQIYISARIIDNKDGKIVSAARVLYTNKDCAIAYLCQKQEAKQARINAQNDARFKMKLKISKDESKEIIPIKMEEMKYNVKKKDNNISAGMNGADNVFIKNDMINALSNSSITKDKPQKKPKLETKEAPTLNLN
jgi:TolB-like protein